MSGYLERTRIIANDKSDKPEFDGVIFLAHEQRQNTVKSCDIRIIIIIMSCLWDKELDRVILMNIRLK